MTIEGFIGTVWSARLLENLQKSLVYGQNGVINRDYEGELAGKGSTVKITSIGDITIGDYTKDTDIALPEALNDAQTTLVATESKYFNFAIDDVSRAQMSNNIMDGAMRQSAYNLANVADQFVAATMVAGVASANKIGTDAQGKVPDTTPLNTAYEYMLQMGTMLSNANVPREGRWIIVPPWFSEKLALDERFTQSPALSGNILTNGVVKQAAGFTVLESNNVPTVAGTGGDAGKTNYKIVAGSGIATTFADSVSKVEAYRPERRMSDAVKGLHVYGAKVVRPSALALLTARAVA